MNRYRAVVMVPTVVEFDNPGSMDHVTSQARRLTNQFDKVATLCSKPAPYEPTLAEVAIISGEVLVDQITPDLPPPMAA